APQPRQVAAEERALQRIDGARQVGRRAAELLFRPREVAAPAAAVGDLAGDFRPELLDERCRLLRGDLLRGDEGELRQDPAGILLGRLAAREEGRAGD